MKKATLRGEQTGVMGEAGEERSETQENRGDRHLRRRFSLLLFIVSFFLTNNFYFLKFLLLFLFIIRIFFPVGYIYSFFYIIFKHSG